MRSLALEDGMSWMTEPTDGWPEHFVMTTDQPHAAGPVMRHLEFVIRSAPRSGMSAWS